MNRDNAKAKEMLKKHALPPSQRIHKDATPQERIDRLKLHFRSKLSKKHLPTDRVMDLLIVHYARNLAEQVGGKSTFDQDVITALRKITKLQGPVKTRLEQVLSSVAP